MDITDISQIALDSDDYRREVLTTERSQAVTMTVQPGDEIGAEVHEGHDQILFFVEGRGTAILDGEPTPIEAGSTVFVQAGTRHNFVNDGDQPLRLVTVYVPPEHPEGTVHETKAEADAAEH